MIIIFVEFIDQLIDYLTNCASLRIHIVNNVKFNQIVDALFTVRTQTV